MPVLLPAEEAPTSELSSGGRGVGVSHAEWGPGRARQGSGRETCEGCCPGEPAGETPRGHRSPTSVIPGVQAGPQA